MYKIYNNLARYVKEERMRRGWNRAEFARCVGHQNVSKGMNRILALEGKVQWRRKYWKKTISALG